MNADEHLHHLRRETGALLASAAVDLAAPVPSCPTWAVRDLLLHVGTTWARAADVLATGREVDRRPYPSVESDTALLAWGRERADEVAGAVEDHSVPDPDGECWTFLPPHTKSFWGRRIALETLLHGWDCRNAVGRTSPMDAELATDGVDEFLFVMLPRCLARNPGTWSGETVHLHRTDTDTGTDGDGDGDGGGGADGHGGGEWRVQLDAGRATVERGHAKGDVAVRGTASDLYLWCAGRGTLATLPALDVVGDRAVAERWSADIRF